MAQNSDKSGRGSFPDFVQVGNFHSHMASASPTHQVLGATRQWLKPLAHVLIRCGVTWREFADLAKMVYVEVATQQFGKRGRATNVSRTALLTGLARREVRKQRERLSSGTEGLTGYVTKASRILSAWHIDPEFLDDSGKPALLPLEGEGATFEALLRRCGAGDLRSITVLKELRAAGAVRELPDGRIEALQRNYVPQKMDAELIRLWGTVVADVASTYVHNLIRDAKTPPRFERAALSDRIDASALPEFRVFLEREGQRFLERVDAWLVAHELRDMDGKSARKVRLGVGLYHLQD